MYAVIMAGGQGSRLRPLTCDLPKPLAPLCGKPVLEYILDLLAEHNCKRAALTLMYQGHRIAERYPVGEYRGIALDFVFEPEPLGTAGSVKNAAKTDEEFLIISGDALCDFDLTAALQYHRERNAMATLVVKQVDDIREYGLVCTGDNGEITGFLEKPSPLYCASNLANTGVYILSPQVLDLIESGKLVDFSMDLFPKMLEEKLPLYAFEAKSYWCDIGDIPSYISCQKDILQGKVRCQAPVNHRDYYAAQMAPEAVHPDVFIGENVTLGSSVVLDEGTVVCDNATIGSGSKLHGSIVLPSAMIGAGSTCNQALVGEGVRLGAFCGVFEHAVVGKDVVMGPHSVLHPGVKVWNNKQISKNTVLRENVKLGVGREWNLEEDGIVGETNVEITASFCVLLGASVASLRSRCVIGVASDSSRTAYSFAQAVAAGAASAEGNVLDFGVCIRPEFSFGAERSGCDFGVYISQEGARTRLVVLQNGILPLERAAERKLEGFLNRGEQKQAPPEEFGEIIPAEGMSLFYRGELRRRAPNGLEGCNVRLECENPAIRRVLKETLRQLKCGNGSDLILRISEEGKHLSAYSGETGYCNEERMYALLCRIHLEREDIAVPETAPSVLEYLAEKGSYRLYRYRSCPCDQTDREARRLAAKKPVGEDALFMTIELLAYLKETGVSLVSLLQEMPSFANVRRRVSIDGTPAELFRRMDISVREIGEGVRLADRLGEVWIRPAKAGRAVWLYAQGKTAETAAELCDFYESVIKERGKEPQ